MSVEALLSGLGSGVVLAWLALPVFAVLARQNRGALPAAYHRVLVLAFALGACVLPLPLLRAAWAAAAGTPVLGSAGFVPLRVVGRWIAPLIGETERAWLTSPLAQAFCVIGVLWMVAAAVAIVRLGSARAHLLHRHAGAVPAEGDVRRRGERIARQLGIAPPRLLVSASASLPFSMGYRVPTVVLPASAAEAAERDLDFMLQHELAHIARGDTRVAFWVSLASVLFTLHPTARRLVREIAFAREASVDAEVAATGALEYARFLLRALESAQADDGACNPAAISMADTALTRRIDMLVKKSPHRSRSARTALSLAASAVALLALVGVAPSSWGAPQEEKPASGNLPREQVERVVRQSYGAFRICYEELPKMVPTKATLSFTIGVDGRVTEGRVEAEISQLGQCVERAMFGLVFPAPVGGVVTVVYPVVFEPG
jgi:beta-lactamase regulating signal transducer with metallopeptidase domain